MRLERNDFQRIHDRALSALPAILNRFLPGGKTIGHEYLALNPHRPDNNLGSFKINLITGKWADFALGICGGDVPSLVAYILSITQTDAAKILFRMLGV